MRIRSFGVDPTTYDAASVDAVTRMSEFAHVRRVDDEGDGVVLCEAVAVALWLGVALCDGVGVALWLAVGDAVGVVVEEVWTMRW
jgi:hypothetical protein